MPRPTVLVLAVLVCIPVFATAQNSPPIVDAGPDQDLLVDELTLLQGSAIDPDNNPILDWLWTVESAPVGSNPYFLDPHRPNTQFSGNLVGDYVLSLIAFDGIEWSAPDSVTMHVYQIQRPVAIATASPTSGSAPLTVQFDGSQSTVDSLFGGSLLYDWNFGDQTARSSDVSPVHTYTREGTYLAVLRVLDDLNQQDSDTVTITVGGVPTKPTTWGRIKALYGE